MNIRIPSLMFAIALAMAGCEAPGDSAETATPASDRPQVTLDLSGFPENARAQATALIEAMNAAPDDADSAGMAGMFAHAYGRPKIAAQYYTRAAELAPDNVVWSYLQGVVLMDTGQDAEALAAFEKSAAIAVDNNAYPPRQLRQAQLMAKAGQTDRARSLLDGIVAASPEYAEGRYHLGKLALDTGDVATAIEQLSEAVRLVPYYGAAHYSLSAAYEADGEADLAATHRALFEKHQRGAPPNSDRLLTRVQNMRRSPQQAIISAGRLSAAGKFKEAAAIFEDLLRVQPDNMVAHTNLIGLYGQLGEIDRAREHYDLGVAIAPDTVPLQSNFGVLMLREGDNEAALAAFNKAIEADASAISAYRYRGIALQRQGDAQGALESFSEAFTRDPLDLQAGYLLGNARLANGDYAQAADVFGRITKPVSQRTPAYLRGLAQANYNAGEFDKAGDALNEARKIALDFGQTDAVEQIDAELAQLAEIGVETP